MSRRQVILVDAQTSQPLHLDWTPTIEESEFQEANRLLSLNCPQWRWQWVGRSTTLAASPTMPAPACTDGTPDQLHPA